MSIINQPFQGQLGDILISELKNSYTNFTIFAAFAKNSGVLRLKESIENFKSKEKDQQQHFKLLPLVLKPLISRHFCLCLLPLTSIPQSQVLITFPRKPFAHLISPCPKKFP